jgi:hypothetical protein
MTTLTELIERSRELEKAATEGPWVHREGSGIGLPGDEHVVVTVHNHGTKSWSRDIAVAAHGHSYERTSDNWPNMEFIASARTTEPLFREALAVAVKALEMVNNCEGVQANEVAREGRAQIQSLVDKHAKGEM